MNKLLAYPMLFMLMLCMFQIAVAMSSVNSSNVGEDNFTIEGQTTYNGIIGLLVGDSATFDVYSITGILGIVMLAVGVGFAVSVEAFGSGVSVFGGRIIFNALLFYGLWVVMLGITSSIVFSNEMFTWLFMGLTMIFTVGFGLQVGGHAD